MESTIQAISNCPEALEDELFDAIAVEMWLHYGRNGALDWHGLEPLLSGTRSRTGFASAGSLPAFEKAVPGGLAVGRIIVTAVSQPANAPLHSHH